MRSSVSSQPAGLAFLLATFRGQLSDACADVTSFPGSSNKPRLRVLRAFDPIESGQGELRADSLHDRKPMRTKQDVSWAKTVTERTSLADLSADDPLELADRAPTRKMAALGDRHSSTWRRSAPLRLCTQASRREVNTPTAVLTAQRLLMS